MAAKQIRFYPSQTFQIALAEVRDLRRELENPNYAESVRQFIQNRLRVNETVLIDELLSLCPDEEKQDARQIGIPGLGTDGN